MTQPLILISISITKKKDAPSLRFVQGREYTLPGSTALGDPISKPNLSSSSVHSDDHEPVTLADLFQTLQERRD